ncbi:response regulator [bacterium]|nr:response regulator [bacterium]
MSGKKLVMIADDDVNIRTVLHKYLEAKNYDIVEAEDGDMAIDMIENQKIMPDLIVLDIMMPGKNGFEVCEHLRAHKLYSLIPILMLTALSTPESVIKGLSLGADDYIKKPFNLEEVQIRIDNILKKGSVSETIKKITEEYKAAADSLSREGLPHIDKLTKLPVLPAIFETLRKKYKDGFYIVYIDTGEVLKYEKIFNWKIIDDFIFKLSGHINEFINSKYYNALIGVKKVYAGDFIVFFSLEHIDIFRIIEELKTCLREKIKEEFPFFEEYQEYVYIEGHYFNREENSRFERAIYQNIYELLAKIEENKRKGVDFAYLSAVSGNVEIKKENVVSIDDKSIGYFVKFMFEKVNVNEIFRFYDDDSKVSTVYRTLIEKAADALDRNTDFFIPVNKAALGEEFLFLVREKKLPQNFIFSFDDIDVSREFFHYREFLEMLKYLNYRIAIFNFGTTSSNFDSIMALKPDYIFLHHMITKDIERNYIKQDLIKSLINVQDKLKTEIIGNEMNRDILKEIGVKYFRGGI